MRHTITAVMVIALLFTASMSYNEAEHIEYLNRLRSESVELETRLQRSQEGIAGFPSLTHAPAGTVGFRLSEELLNRILHTYLSELPMIQDINVLFLMNRVAVDGKFRFVNEAFGIDLLVPFTIESSARLSAQDGKSILVDVHKVTLWKDCHLPTNTLLEAVMRFVNESRLGEEFVSLEYQEIDFQAPMPDNPYSSFGRVKITPVLQGSLPIVPEITILDVGVRNHEMKVVGQ